LPPASAEEFLEALLGDDPSLAPLKQLLIARTEGNPFFLEESVRTLVEALEALAPERVGEPVERLAHHALRGEVWDKAVPYCQQAGVRAFDRAAFREAGAAFEQALQALAHLPEPGDTQGLAIDLRLGLGRSLYILGEFGRLLALLGEAEALARALNDRARLGRVLAEMARALRTTGDHDGAIAAGRQALETRSRARRQRLADASIPAPGAGIPDHRRLRLGGRAATMECGGCGPGA
jgi:tetratricopeptide (TPR) repeat protein